MLELKPSGWLCAVVVLSILGCHGGKPEDLPMFERKIGIPDRFYDVQALDAKRAVVVGYAGKILLTEDSGITWEILPSGTRQALYDIEMVTDQEGWICGQQGLILHTTDGGRTWTRQQSGVVDYLFAMDFLSEEEGWVIGDEATYLHTTDGGHTWRSAKMPKPPGMSAEEALVFQDPVLYDLHFVDRQNGWVVGEFGKIYHTSDGGRTWNEQQGSLIGEGGVYDALDLPTFFGVHFRDRQNGIVAGLEGSVARTRDGGATWAFDEFDVEIEMADPLYNPTVLSDGSAWVVGAAGQVARQERPDQPWRRANLGMDVPSWIRGIDFHDPQHGWLVGGYGLILHTEDGGKTWLPSVG